jgi:hypothetical protein
MKVAELRQIIKEEVQQAIKTELRELLIEAVQIASQPSAAPTVEQKQPIQQVKPSQPSVGYRPIEELLEETKLNFTSEDAKTFVSQDLRQEMNQAFSGNSTAALASKLGMLESGNQPGLDLNSLPFLKNAKTILNKSIEKDKIRSGVS